MLNLDPAQLATVRAALTVYQSEGYGEPSERPEHIHVLATDSDRQISLDYAGISQLIAALSVPTDTREAIKCPKCESGQLQCVRDASVTHSVVGAVMKEISSTKLDGTVAAPYRFAEAELSNQNDVNIYDEYRLCCNECDETFDDEEIYDLVHPAEATPQFTCQGCGREESVCSADPCEGVKADRIATMPDHSEDFMRGDC